MYSTKVWSKGGARALGLLFLALFISSILMMRSGVGQGTDRSPPSSPLSETVDGLALQKLAEEAQAPKPNSKPLTYQGIDVLSLLVKGGGFMIPIALVSIMVVAFVVERMIGLRSRKMLPRGLVRRMTQLIRESDTVDPRLAYPICMDYPSVASTVLREVMVRAGRPLSEIESAVSDVCQREADKAYAGIRWLNFCAGVAPLLGLLGTVWGLIRAFHDMTMLSSTDSRAEFLGNGIYVALVTTLAGLIVAIPAALASHYFEGRLTLIFHRIEEIAQALIRKLERYEGKMRYEAIGTELVARTIEPIKKAVTQPSEAPRVPPPPVQVASHPATTPHVNPTQPSRQAIYKKP